MMYVLDASAVMNVNALPDGQLFTTQEVEFEVRDLRSRMVFQTGRIKVMEPDQKSIEKVKGAAKTTGDITQLSEADISVLALALELNATILTDDYDIQNLAKVMGIAYKAVSTKGIRETFVRRMYCDGCQKFREEAIEQERAIEKTFIRCHAGFIKYRTDESFVKPLVEWFNVWGVGRG